MAGHSRGRHQRHDPSRGWTRVARLAAGVVAAAVLGYGGAAVALRGPDGDSCPNGGRTLDVVTAPEIAPVLAQVARALAQPAEDQSPEERCRRTTVRAEDPYETATALRRPGGARPDVWVPDASSWLPASSGAAPSVARSPVVLALVPGIAAPASAEALLAGAAPVRLELPDPRRSAPAAAAIAALAGLDRATLTGALRASRTGLATPTARLLGQLRPDVALPVSEQAVATMGTDRPVTVPLAGPALDYPFLVLADGPRATDARRLLDAVRGEAGRAVVRAAGFRPPAGGTVLTSAAADTAARTLEAVRRDSRMLTLIDVSGSMGERVPGAGGARRIDLTRAAALEGLGLLPDDSRVGLWVFSTDLAPDADFRELARIRPLDRSGRALIGRSLAGLRHVPGGGTGLYDTTLAAVRAVRAGWDPTRINSVVLLSDGRNDDENGIGLATLLATLRREGAGSRPVPVVTIAFGAESDPAALAAISRATGGSSYVARDPREIRRVFLDAVGRRPCRPAC